jgi:hypothetical protein
VMMPRATTYAKVLSQLRGHDGSSFTSLVACLVR